MPRTKVVLERDIEKAVCETARAAGCLVRKMNGEGQRAWPDRMFITPRGKIFFIEFKRPGAEPTALQTALHMRLAELNQTVFVVDNVAKGRELVRSQL